MPAIPKLMGIVTPFDKSFYGEVAHLPASPNATT
jgi:hypothetical protein